MDWPTYALPDGIFPQGFFFCVFCGVAISFRRAVGDRRAAGAVVPDSELIYLTAIRVHKRQRVAGNGITHACGYACNLIVRQPAAACAAQIRPDDRLIHSGDLYRSVTVRSYHWCRPTWHDGKSCSADRKGKTRTFICRLRKQQAV